MANKVIKDNQEGNHNATTVSINSYKLNAQIILNIEIVIKRKSNDNWWDAPGLDLLRKMLVSMKLGACGPSNTYRTYSSQTSDSSSTST
jgi:hypothetical protein